MPFSQIVPRPFTTAGVEIYAPQEPGLYGISSPREWIYIGYSPNIQQALLDCLEDSASALMQRQPRGFVFELCDQMRGARRQDALVMEYEPACNRHSTP